MANKNRDSDTVQLDNYETNNETYKDTSYYTSKQITQKAHVSTETIARYNAAMKYGVEKLRDLQHGCLISRKCQNRQKKDNKLTQ